MRVPRVALRYCRVVSDVSNIHNELSVEPYEDWMLPQVAELFAEQYHRPPQDEAEQLRRFYDHHFQKDRCMRFVALERDTVVGFQSYFYWPYRYGGETLRSYQAGRALVSPALRGQGVFQRLLKAIDSAPPSWSPDVLIGFPVDQSLGSFLRNDWSNPLDLRWFVKVSNPVSLIRPRPIESVLSRFDAEPEMMERAESPEVLTLSAEGDFLDWRRSILHRGHYCYFHYSEGASRARIDLKFNRRGRVFELVIGDFSSTTNDPSFAKKALRDLVRRTRTYRFVTTLSCAINPHSVDRTWSEALSDSGFRQIKPRIYFIVKRYAGPPQLDDGATWRLLRSDVDTW